MSWPPSGVSSLAHGIGGQHDLPVSPFYAYAGGLLALLVSFLAMGLLWSRPRFNGETAGRPVPDPVRRLAGARGLRLGLRLLGLAGFCWLLQAAFFGPENPGENAAPGLLYAVLWAGLVPVSLLLGPIWRLIDPLRALHAFLCWVIRRDPSAGAARLPGWLGHWPAAAGLLAFTWTELAAPDASAPSTVAVFVLCYSCAQLAAAAWAGDRWFDRGDAFTVYSTLIGHLAPLGRRPSDGALVLRNPLHGLDALPRTPGLTAAVLVLLGSTGYDSLSGTPWWVRTVQSGPLDPTLTRTLGLLTAIILVAVLYLACASAARAISGGSAPAGSFTHSLVPIAIGYLVAHYLTLLLTEVQRTVAMVPDPSPPFAPGTLAAVQVLAIVTGHVIGVVAAHDRSVRLFPPDRAVAGQVPLLVLMVCYTLGGITLLLVG